MKTFLKYIKFTVIVLVAGLNPLLIQAQDVFHYQYYPLDFSQTEWKTQTHLYYQTHNNSNSTTNQFAQSVYGSQYLDASFIDNQVADFQGHILAGRSTQTAAGVWFKPSQDNPSFAMFAGIDNQQILDAKVNENLAKLMLLGNKPFEGEKLDLGQTTYQNIYFNRLKLGISKTWKKQGVQHQLNAILAFNAGQNYQFTEVNRGYFHTYSNGEYLDLALESQSKLSDTVWSNLLTLSGIGGSADIYYSMSANNSFFLSAGVKNLGVILWNRHPWQGRADTTIHFGGIDENDYNQLPESFSESSLRDLIFTQPQYESFSTQLPRHIHLSAGKFFFQTQFYLGLTARYYPTLLSKFYGELFLTWNIAKRVRVSPILMYSSFRKINAGLAIETVLWKKLSLEIASGYLNSAFQPQAPLGQGLELRLVFSH